MHLNADIVFDNLPANLHAHITGPRTMDLQLERPHLYEGNEQTLKAHRLYLVHADRVPQRAHAEAGSVIVCIGDTPRLDRYRNRCCVITVDRETDFYHMFNIIQSIFDRYTTWHDDLVQAIERDGSIGELLTSSEQVFQNPMFVLDENFRILGASATAVELEANPNMRPQDAGSLRLGAFDQFLELHDLSMDEREPLVLTLLDQTTLSLNLYEGEEFQGCLVVACTKRPYRPSDKPLIALLGRFLLTAMRQLSRTALDGPGSLRQAVKDMVEERPLDPIGRELVEGADNGQRYVCMRLKLSNQLEQLPLGYVRNTLESTFPHSIVFDYHRNSVVAVIGIEAMDDPRDTIRRGIEPFCGSMEMKAGLSTPQRNLFDVRALFLQADAALDMGMLFAPNESFYPFSDYALRKMVMDGVGDMRLELLFPEGLLRLIEHDRESATSYVETLRTFLDCNTSIAKTASELYVHRSTLIERMTRIKRDLAIDFDDPDEQLRLRILLKALQVRNELRSNQNSR